MDFEKPATWRRYREGLCDDCMADCCKMTVEVKVADLLKMGVIDDFEAGEPIKSLAKSLSKQNIIRRFSHRHETFTLAQHGNKDCIFLDQETRKCTVYENRPDTCRDNPEKISHRIGHCPYVQQ